MAAAAAAAAAAATCKNSLLTIVLALVLGLAAHTETVSAQNCLAGLGGLTVCAPFVVPGVGNGPPNQQCCSSLSAMDHSCICNTIDIINRLPSSCKLPPISCSA